MPPRIGIPPSVDTAGRIRAPRVYHYLHAAYAEAVTEAGGLAMYLPPREGVDALLAQLDGLLLPGGGDLPPPRPYPDGVRFDRVPERQLDFDRRLLAGALGRGLPVLAICYGMQLLVLEQGGELLYHIPSDRPEALPHRLEEAEERHTVLVEPDTRLARLLGRDREPVNSRHHQGVADAGPRLRVAARSEDGLVEAVEGPGDGLCLGVQWHPEELAGGHRRAIFAVLVKAAAARAGA